MTRHLTKITRLSSLANWAMMIALFLNPFGFDIVQYWLISLTGTLWNANIVLYCLAGLFFGLSFLFRILYKNKMKHVKIKAIDEETGEQLQ